MTSLAGSSTPKEIAHAAQHYGQDSYKRPPNLFAAHCECRPLDMWRAKYEHSHDCDTEILDDIKKAGGWIGVVATAKQTALAQCAEHWNRDLASDIYAPLLAAAWTEHMDNRG